MAVKINTCGHPELRHEARGMCPNCYKRFQYERDSKDPERLAKRKQRGADYYNEHKEHIIQNVKAYYRENTEERKSQIAAWQRLHPDRIKAYYKKHQAAHYAKSREWAAAHPDENRTYKRESMQRKRLKNYGLSQQELEAMIARSGGKCDLCEREFGTEPGTQRCIDHCHETGTVRGLLCFSCNVALGHFRDSPDIIHSAIEYLQKHSTPEARPC